jgi:hypothetical protein
MNIEQKYLEYFIVIIGFIFFDLGWIYGKFLSTLALILAQIFSLIWIVIYCEFFNNKVKK